MKALSLRQPWAWAVAHAGKRLENRVWKSLRRGLEGVPADVRGQMIAIHASGTPPTPDDVRGVLQATGKYDAPLDAQVLPREAIEVRGAIVAVARVAGVMRCTEPMEIVGGIEGWPCFDPWTADILHVLHPLLGPIPATEQLTRWWLGPFALVLTDVTALKPIGDVSGMLGFWKVKEKDEATIRAQIPDLELGAPAQGSLW